MQFGNPADLQEAYKLLSQGSWKILAGGTDFYPSLGSTVPSFNVLDISNVQAMRDIVQDEQGNWHIGSLVTWTDLIEEELPDCFTSLKRSAREIGSLQIQNRATIVGNICNASPAADGVPPLLTLNAIVKIGSLRGAREILLGDFIQGNRKTDLQPDEMVTGIKIPANALNGRSSFLKLGARKYLVISISMAAARLDIANGVINDAAIAVGSCSLVATRLLDLERQLVGRKVKEDLSSLIDENHFSVLAPIDDVRATRQYRMQAAKELVKRVIDQTLEGV